MGPAPGRRAERTVLVVEHVTGGGLAGHDLPASWAAEGSAMRRTLARDFAAVPGVRVVMTLDARLPDEPGPWTAVRVGPDEAHATLTRHAAQADHTALIAPETAGVLRQLTQAIVRARGRTLGGSPASIDLAGDKLRLAERLKRAGVPTPESRRVRPRDGLPRDGVYPAVLKPIDGAGSIDTLFLASPDDPIVAGYALEFGLLQPFIPGQPRSATFLVGAGTPPRLIGVGLQHMTRTEGRFAYEGGSILPEGLPLDHPARRALDAVPGLRGLVGVDYLHDPTSGVDQAVVLDVNPRPTTSCVGLVAALGPGRLAAAWLATLADSRPDPSDPESSSRPLVRLSAPLSFRADGAIVAPVSRRTLIPLTP